MSVLYINSGFKTKSIRVVFFELNLDVLDFLHGPVSLVTQCYAELIHAIQFTWLLMPFIDLRNFRNDVPGLYALVYVNMFQLLYRFCKHTDENKRQKVALILDKLITMTIDEEEMYPSIQAKIWGNIGQVSDLLDMVLDSFIKVRPGVSLIFTVYRPINWHPSN